MQVKSHNHKCLSLGGKLKQGLFRQVVIGIVVGICACPSSLSHAEPVSVNSPAGQGFAFNHNGNCFIMLPAHVHDSGTALNLSAGSPATVGAADVMHSFAGMDLSIASVTGGLVDRCAYEFDSFPLNVDEVVSLGGRITLVNVSETGRVDRLRGQIESIGYDALTFELEDGVSIYQGRSGSIVLAGETPIAMLVEALDDGQGYALRMDTIRERIGRLIDHRASINVQTETAISGPRSNDMRSGLSGLGAFLTACSDVTVAPESNCWAFAKGDAPLLIDSKSLPFTIDVRLSNEGAVLRQAILQADAAAADSTTPKSVIVLRATGSQDRPGWSTFGRGDMSPQGFFSAQNGDGVRTRGVQIVILDGWFINGDEPIRLDGIELR